MRLAANNNLLKMHADTAHFSLAYNQNRGMSQRHQSDDKNESEKKTEYEQSFSDLLGKASQPKQEQATIDEQMKVKAIKDAEEAAKY